MSKMLALIAAVLFTFSTVAFAQAPAADQKPADQKMEAPAKPAKKAKKAKAAKKAKKAKAGKAAMKKADDKGAAAPAAAPAPAANPTK